VGQFSTGKVGQFWNGIDRRRRGVFGIYGCHHTPIARNRPEPPMEKATATDPVKGFTGRAKQRCRRIQFPAGKALSVA